MKALSSKARTATPDPVVIGRSKEAKGVHIYIKSTAATGSPSVVFNVEGLDTASGDWYALLASAAVVNGSTVRRLKVHPLFTASANLIAQDVLPPVLRIRPVHSNTDSITYSVGVDFIN